jgi:hypothetical protein
MTSNVASGGPSEGTLSFPVASIDAWVATPRPSSVRPGPSDHRNGVGVLQPSASDHERVKSKVVTEPKQLASRADLETSRFSRVAAINSWARAR